MRSFAPDRVYLAGWPLTRDFPHMASDAAPLEALWGRARGVCPPRLYAGPSLTVSGLHAHTYADTLCAQLRGVKEWLLFAPDQSALLRPTRKYLRGGACAGVDICNLGADAPALRSFERASGLFARAEPGDVLFIPAGWWHAAVAEEPGLTVSSARRGGGPCGALADAAAAWAHEEGYLAQGWCVCHETQDLAAMQRGR